MTEVPIDLWFDGCVNLDTLGTQNIRGEVGIFFVWKSDGERIRMILDARGPNRVFRDPPGVELCAAEGFSRIEVIVPEDHLPGTEEFREDLRNFGLFFGLSDIKGRFHRLRIPDWLAEFFCLKPIPCEWVGMDGKNLGGRILSKGVEIYLMAGSLPMRFTWSLYFAQTISKSKIQKVPGLEGSKLVSDGGAAMVFRAPVSPGIKEVRHYVYVDNLGAKPLSRTKLWELACVVTS